MDLANMIERAAAKAEDVVKGISPGQLDQPTPCKDWDVRKLGNHLTNFLQEAADAARKSEPSATGDTDYAGGDGWAENFSRMAGEMVDSWKREGALEGDTHLGQRPIDAGSAASVAVSELVIHAWDLATATGQTYHPDEDLAHLSLQVATGGQSQGPNEFYGPPVEVGEDKPIFHQALGMSGRRPDWEHLGPTTQGHD